MKITYKSLVHGQNVVGSINGIKVKLTVDLQAGKDRTFKLRPLDINDNRGWDYGALDTSCYDVLNGVKTLQEAFERFGK